ncbi:hypothetical protein BDFB_011026 [Asbolus verrucosus]|uniref:Uncharacterized protein n=1 Tax=Asbolus verrucosus TaxID=1661398 RepID=A0A482W7I2_ASBVE|nr:hypothetical protein BDFB_011026 [Asbolus verrucosus]
MNAQNAHHLYTENFVVIKRTMAQSVALAFQKNR